MMTWTMIDVREERGEGGIIPSEYMMNVVIWLKLTEGDKWHMESKGVHVRREERHRHLSVSSPYWRETTLQRQPEGRGVKLWFISHSKHWGPSGGVGGGGGTREHIFSQTPATSEWSPGNREEEKGRWATWLTARKERGDLTARVSKETSPKLKGDAYVRACVCASVRVRVCVTALGESWGKSKLCDGLVAE